MKTAIKPIMVVDRRRGWEGNLMERGATYSRRFNWKVQTKKTLKWSNISVKKYQKMPMLGVSSGTVRINP